MINNVTFTDPQNNTWTDAVFIVASIYDNDYSSSHSNGRFVRDPNDFTTLHDQSSPNSDSGRNMTVQYYYWTSQANYDARGPLATDPAPYLLADMSEGHRNTYWQISNEELQDPKYATLTPEQIADLYLQEVILPSLA